MTECCLLCNSREAGGEYAPDVCAYWTARIKADCPNIRGGKVIVRPGGCCEHFNRVARLEREEPVKGTNAARPLSDCTAKEANAAIRRAAGFKEL